jgi:hypothetical protein
MTHASRASAAASWSTPGRTDTALYGTVLALLIAPFFLFDTIPLYDLPNQIARQHLLFDPTLADSYYEAHWRLVPDLAMEGVVFLLHHIFSVDVSIRIFLALTVAQLFLGTLALHHAMFGRCGRLPLTAALFAYTGPLLLGLVNFCFGLGLALWAFALWLRWRERALAIPILGVLASLILLAHLLAFCVYVLVVASCWARVAVLRLRSGGGAAAVISASGCALSHLAAPAALYLIAMSQESLFPAGAVGWQKIAALSSLLGYIHPTFDGLYLLAVVVAAILIAPRLAIASELRWPLACLTIAFLALPYRLGQTTFVDYRLPLCIVLFLIGGTAWRDRADFWRPYVAAAAVGLLVLRLSLLYGQWASWQTDYAQIREAFELLPPGARLLPLAAEPGAIDLYDHPPLGHVAALAVAERGALIPTLLADSDHRLVTYARDFAALSTPAPTISDASNYDYMLLIHPEQFERNLLPPRSEIARGRSFALARLLRSNEFAQARQSRMGDPNQATTPQLPQAKGARPGWGAPGLAFHGRQMRQGERPAGELPTIHVRG